ncbi:MAG TPA: prepilin-type N-terminal cleavage/methylation domain-containing protein [Desulfobacteraceae bacterium]|nr:prepilin-type N-terminal cleavage/methylation domain-containing protein [Desulfobacteraceae bacterium]
MREIDSGFSLIELIGVLILIAIISAVVVSRIGITSPDLYAQAEILKTRIRYAQLKSFNSERVWGVRIQGNKYWLFRDGDLSNRVPFPGEESDTISIPSGMSISPNNMIISFNFKGVPCTDQSGSNPQNTDRTITISSGGDSVSIQITKNTGFIP